MESTQNSESTEARDLNPEPKRKRLAQACEICRRKKVKCDGGRPSCGNCLKLRRECTYNPNVKKRGPRQGYIEMLEKRLDKMEKLLTSSNALKTARLKDSTQEASARSPTDSGDGHDDNDSTSIDEDSDSLRNGLPSVSSHSTPVAGGQQSASSNTTSLPTGNPAVPLQGACGSAGQHAMALQSICAPACPPLVYPHNILFQPDASRNFSSPTSAMKPESSVLPPQEIIDHLVTLYLEYVNVNTPLFIDDMLRMDIRNNRCSDFFILSLLSVSARFSERPDIREDPPWHSGEKYAKKAREMLPRIIDSPSLMNVQALLLLTVHEYGCARGPRSWMYSGMVARMALELGLNKELDQEEFGDEPLSAEKWMQQEARRKAFWMAFVLDKFMCATTGRPGILHEEDCDILMPCDEDGWRKGHFYTETADQSRVALFNVQALKNSNLLGISPSTDPVNDLNGRQATLSNDAYFLRACVLLGRITTFVNRGGRIKKALPPSSPDSEFTLLDQQISNWYKNLPERLKYQPNSAEQDGSKRTKLDHRSIMLNILHCTLIVLLHRPSLVLADTLNTEVIQQSLRDFVHNSAAKCLKAVDNVSALMKEIRNDPKLTPPFVTYFTYTVATITVNNTFSSKPADVKQAREALDEHFKFLKSVRPYWAMADKLYFMIRDLYAMHNNLIRHQGRPPVSVLRKNQDKPAESQATSDVHPPPTSLSSLLQPQAYSQVAQPLNLGNLGQESLPFSQDQTLPPIGYTGDVPGSQPIRSMSLADLSLSTCDGASCTDWILGDNSENIAASLQSIGRMSGQGYQSMFDLTGLANVGSSLQGASAPQPNFAQAQWPLDFSHLSTNMESQQLRNQ